MEGEATPIGVLPVATTVIPLATEATITRRLMVVGCTAVALLRVTISSRLPPTLARLGGMGTRAGVRGSMEEGGVPSFIPTDTDSGECKCCIAIYSTCN